MCGRGACSLDPDTLKRRCNVQQFINSYQYHPSYNLCPNSFVPVLLLQDKMLQYYQKQMLPSKQTTYTPINATNQRILSAMRWGLVPSFSKDNKSHFRTINARQDTIKTSKMYRRLISKKRCIVLLNGYYEWQSKKQSKHKQPYYFTPQYKCNDTDRNQSSALHTTAPLMYCAGLWDVWRPPNDNNPINFLFSVTIVTTDSNKDVSFCHDRMPLIMTEHCVAKWLDETYSIDVCFKCIQAAQQWISIKSHAVPREIVGNTKNIGIECIQTMDEYEAKKKKTGLFRFFKAEKSVPNIQNKNVRGKTDEVNTNMKETVNSSLDSNEGNDKKRKTLKKWSEENKDEMQTDNEDQALLRAIEASKESFRSEQQKRGKKRKLNDSDSQDLESLDELNLSTQNANAANLKKQKLNDGSSKKQANTKRNA